LETSTIRHVGTAEDVVQVAVRPDLILGDDVMRAHEIADRRLHPEAMLRREPGIVLEVEHQHGVHRGEDHDIPKGPPVFADLLLEELKVIRCHVRTALRSALLISFTHLQV
jgi:hypothetical protein